MRAAKTFLPSVKTAPPMVQSCPSTAPVAPSLLTALTPPTPNPLTSPSKVTLLRTASSRAATQASTWIVLPIVAPSVNFVPVMPALTSATVLPTAQFSNASACSYHSFSIGLATFMP